MNPPVYNSEWSDLVKSLYDHDMQEIWDPSIAPHVCTMYNDELFRYQAIAGRHPLKILDVGCAQGTLALRLAEAGHRVWAADLRPEFLEYARSRYEYGEIDFITGNALEMVLVERFDLVFANQILEHLVLPVSFLRRLASFLAPGGRIVVTTPSAEYLKNNLPTFRGLGDPALHLDRQFFPDGDEHFFAYTAAELAELAGEAGLRDISVIRYASPWITGHMRIRHLHGRIPRSVLRALDRLTLALPGLRTKLGYQLMLTGAAGT